MITTDSEQSPDNLPALHHAEAEALGNDIKRILVKSEQALVQGDAKGNMEKLERWIESYRRGLSAAQKISDNGCEMLCQAREQLQLARDELLRLEGEGGNTASKQQEKYYEQLTRAINSIDSLIPVVEHSFHSNGTEPKVA